MAEQTRQTALIVGLEILSGDRRNRLWSGEESLDELTSLAETAGAEIAGRILQRRQHPDPNVLLGEGKLEEVEAERARTGADLVIFDQELSPSQQRNIEKVIQAPVIDRTSLILDIFAQRARTKEAHLQVELAQLEFRLPRLAGRGTELSRLGGGIGTRGPGETKLEVDRRRLRDRISHLRHELKDVVAHRTRLRQARAAGRVPVVALAGYTNAGKSTLLNRLTGAGVLAENKLFATLDPTSRRVEPVGGEAYVLVDTVGFIQNLPHDLVAAFRSTLEEVREADLVLHVVDASHPKRDEQMQTVDQVLQELGATAPVLTVINKADRLTESGDLDHLLRHHAPAAGISALVGDGIEQLQEAIQTELRRRRERLTVLVPYNRSALIALIHQRGQVLAEEHTEEGTQITAELERAWAAKVRSELGLPAPAAAVAEDDENGGPRFH